METLTYYENCEEFLAGRPSRRLAKNLRVLKRDDEYVVRYYTTDIVTYHADRTVTLRHGGWPTASTKWHINDYSPVSIWQENRCWYVILDGLHIPFRDGMRIDPRTERILN